MEGIEELDAPAGVRPFGPPPCRQIGGTVLTYRTVYHADASQVNTDHVPHRDSCRGFTLAEVVELVDQRLVDVRRSG